MKKVIHLINILFFQMVVFGQAGQVDPSFVCGYSDFYYNNADIQSDEKLLVSRGITDPASGSISHTIHRFLNNGNDDNTFNKPYATGSFSQTNYNRLGILAIKVLSDDRIMVGGVFDKINNAGQPTAPCVNLARLLPNGDIDPTFQFNLETYLEAVTTIFVNSEDEVIIGGDRTFSRIFEDGSIDESFGDNFFEFFTTIETIDQFSNGKYLVGGDLTIVYNSYLMRLLPDGNPDSSWDTGTGFNGKVTKVIIQPDQKILVIGSFSQFNGTPANRICRLNEDGTLDTSFDIGTGPNGTAILNDMILQPDGKIIIAGRLIYSFNGHNRQATVRLNPDGSVDTSYGETGYIRYDSQYPGIIRSLLQLPNSRIIAAGYFFNFRFFSGANFNSIGVMRLFNCTNSTETQTINACNSYTWIDGITYFSNNNTATHTFQTAGGCDSTITLNLTITPFIDADVLGETTICSNTASTVSVDLAKPSYNYTLRNNQDNSVVAGPISGSGEILEMNTGILSETTTFNVLAEKAPNTSLQFDGTDDRVHFGNPAAMDFTNDFTIETWVKPTTGGAARQGIFSSRLNNNSGSFQLEIGAAQNGTRRFGVSGVLNWLVQTPNNVYELDEWVHVAYTKSGSGSGTHKLFVNGVEQASSSSSSYVFSNNASSKILGSGTSNTQFLNGSLDEFRIWNYARSEAEIAQSMNQELTGEENGLISYLKFNELAETTTAYDNSGNGIHGTLTNMDIANARHSDTPFQTGVCSNQLSQTVTVEITAASEAPSAVTSLYNLCHGGSTQLEIQGGSLTDGAQWEWFSGSCNATPIGTGSTLEVSPNANTTYYARASAGSICPASDCASVVVNMPATSTNLSVDGEHATCFVNQNGWVHFYNNAGNLIASIKSNGQDLGNVQVTSHVANSPYQSASCTEENNASFFQANLQRTFVITPEHQPTNPVQVRLYVLDNEISAYQTAAMATTQNPHDDITTISDLHMTKVSGGTGSGDPADFCGSNATAEFLLQDASGNINDAATSLSGFTATSYLEFTIDAFSEFFPMNANNSALPVSLTHFSANCLGEKIGIQWTTASEFNASHYIVQSSRDGFVWLDLARISAVGTTNQISNYSYEDKNVGALTYYRLVQIDNDGEQEIFGPISSNCTLEYNLMTVYPNPASDNFTVLIQTAEVFENAHIELVDLSGRVVMSQSTEIQSGSTMLNFDVKAIQPGAYIVRVKGENDSFAPIRVVKM